MPTNEALHDAVMAQMQKNTERTDARRREEGARAFRPIQSLERLTALRASDPDKYWANSTTEDRVTVPLYEEHRTAAIELGLYTPEEK